MACDFHICFFFKYFHSLASGVIFMSLLSFDFAEIGQMSRVCLGNLQAIYLLPRDAKILFRVKVICPSFFPVFVYSGLKLQVQFQVFEAHVLMRPGPVGMARSPGLFQSGEAACPPQLLSILQKVQPDLRATAHMLIP